MCPDCKHLQVFMPAFCNDFHLTARQIAHPPGKCKFLGLVVGGESKPDSLHPSANNQMQPRESGFVLGLQLFPASTDSSPF